MPRLAAFLAGSVLLAALAATPACGPANPPAPNREDAFRANNRGVALLEQFKYPEAAEAFREALRIDGSLALARVNLSLALLYALDLQGAAREAAEASRLLPSAAQPRYVLGLIARAENRTAEARREFERVAAIDSGDVGTAIHLGQIHLEERQYEPAIAMLRRATAAEPFNVTAAYNLGLALTRSGQADEGRSVLERAQALRATGYAITYGTGYLEQGRYAEAVASTGNEPELVVESVPAISFAPAPIGAIDNAAAPAASPFGRQPVDWSPQGLQRLAAGLGGGVTLIDIENDGDLDLFTASMNTQRLLRNESGKGWTDVTGASGIGDAPPSVVAVGCVAGDYDNDGMTDLFVVGYGGNRLLRNEGNGRFADMTAKSGVGAYPFLPGAAAFVDVDHDGDLDLAIAGLADLTAPRGRGPRQELAFPADFAAPPVRLLRNNGGGTFTDISTAARLGAVGRAIAIVPTDFDNRRDIDLLIINRGGPPMLYQNLRDGTFRDVSTETGLSAVVGSDDTIAVAAGDVNKDDFPDFFFSQEGRGIMALSDGRGRFAAGPAPAGAGGAVAAQFADYDNDGLLDLLTWSATAPRVFRNLGHRWEDVSKTAVAAATVVQPVSARGWAFADLDGDGATDFVIAGSAGLAWWRNGAQNTGGRSFRVQLKGRVSNRLGIGAKVQLRAGSLKARFETSAATPPVATADIVFGLGARSAADVVRVLWPSGILQAEAVKPSSAAASGSRAPAVIEELDRKPSSCPYLFTWNGERFEFVTDFMGGGEMGYWEAPGKRNVPDPLEYVRIRGDQLKAKDGRFQLRVTNELEEALFVDRLQLISLVHPQGIEIYPNEGMTEPPKPHRLFAVAGERVPRTLDQHGHDVTERISRVDQQYPDDFALGAIRGYAGTHSLTMELAPVEESPVLVLTAWTDYAFSSDNVAAQQAGLALSPPSLQVRDTRGGWRTAVADIGIPVGRPQAIPIDLSGLLRPGEHEVRVSTNMRIYWDRIVMGRAVPTDRLAATPIAPRTAVLRERGFSTEVGAAGNAPAGYDYERVTPDSPWKIMAGRYTRIGDVRELLLNADDLFVIARPGDEIALEFDAHPAPVPAGSTETFLLLADGYSKEMDINSASPDTVEPLPFHAMSGYPYSARERYPETAAHERYRATYNTRVIVRTVPSIDLGIRKPSSTRQ